MSLSTAFSAALSAPRRLLGAAMRSPPPPPRFSRGAVGTIFKRSPLLLVVAAMMAPAVFLVVDGLSPAAQAQQTTRSVHFFGHTRAFAEVDDHGLRRSVLIDVEIDPPLEVRSMVLVKIQDRSTATAGEDYTLPLPPADPGIPAVRTLVLPAGVSKKSFGMTFRKDFKTEGEESVYLELVPIDNAPYVSEEDIGNSIYSVVELLVNDWSQAIPADADPNRGIAIEPRTLTTSASSAVDYTVALASMPAADVVVRAYFDTLDGAVHLGSAGSALRVSPESLTFTSTNWSTPQTFTVTPQDGSGSVGRHLIINGLQSPSDPNYDSTTYFTGPGIDGTTHVRVVVTAGGL